MLSTTIIRPSLVALLLTVVIIVTTTTTTTTALPSRRQATRRTLFSHKKKYQKPSSSSRGTQFTLRRPTRQRASELFAGSDDVPFNHATAGMTNPSLHIAVNNQVVMHISATKTTSIKDEASIQREDPKTKNSWWPETATAESNKWRKMEYCRTMGHGKDCYEAVRNKVLAWEFEYNNQGIVALDESSSTNNRPSTSSALSIGNCPRLATYTRSVIGLWCVSPVQVAYDAVDQRGQSATYTSSAYATLHGHALVGEERLTVALRDNDSRVDVQLISYSKPGKWWTKVAFGMVHKMQAKFFSNQMEYLQTVATEATTTTMLLPTTATTTTR